MYSMPCVLQDMYSWHEHEHSSCLFLAEVAPVTVAIEKLDLQVTLTKGLIQAEIWYQQLKVLLLSLLPYGSAHH